jgi:hypothetical protein
VKVDQQIINNLQEAEELYRSKNYNSLDSIILSKCTGCNMSNNKYFWLWSNISNWINNKSLNEKGIIVNEWNPYKASRIIWKDWVKVLKNELYYEFYNYMISRYEKIKSMTIYNKWYENADSILLGKEILKWFPKWVPDNVEKPLESKNLPFIMNYDGLEDESIIKIGKAAVEYRAYSRLIEVHIELNMYAKNDNKEKDLHSSIDNYYVVDVIIRDNTSEVGIIKSPRKVPLSEFKNYAVLDSQKEFLTDIGDVNKGGMQIIKSELVEYGEDMNYCDFLLELYTGYLKYGSVDNYIKYCQEDEGTKFKGEIRC